MARTCTCVIVTTPISPTAFAARPVAAFVAVCVGFIVGVSIRAMRLRQVCSPKHIAALYVLLVTDWFKMIRFHTRRVVAKMVEFSVIGDLPYSQPVSKSMCQYGLTPKRGVPIAEFVFIARPNPTVGSLVHFAPEGCLVLPPTMSIDKTPRWSSLLSAATFAPHGEIITHANN